MCNLVVLLLNQVTFTLGSSFWVKHALGMNDAYVHCLSALISERSEGTLNTLLILMKLLILEMFFSMEMILILDKTEPGHMCQPL